MRWCRPRAQRGPWRSRGRAACDVVRHEVWSRAEPYARANARASRRLLRSFALPCGNPVTQTTWLARTLHHGWLRSSREILVERSRVHQSQKRARVVELVDTAVSQTADRKIVRVELVQCVYWHSLRSRPNPAPGTASAIDFLSRRDDTGGESRTMGVPPPTRRPPVLRGPFCFPDSPRAGTAGQCQRSLSAAPPASPCPRTLPGPRRAR